MHFQIALLSYNVFIQHNWLMRPSFHFLLNLTAVNLPAINCLWQACAQSTHFFVFYQKKKKFSTFTLCGRSSSSFHKGNQEGCRFPLLNVTPEGVQGLETARDATSASFRRQKLGSDSLLLVVISDCKASVLSVLTIIPQYKLCGYHKTEFQDLDRKRVGFFYMYMDKNNTDFVWWIATFLKAWKSIS